MRSTLLVLVSNLALAACGSSPSSSAGGEEGGSAELPAYDGPELKASVQTEPTQPPHHTLVVEVNVPTGGYVLALASFDGKSRPRQARFVLTSPASDELVIQAFQQHTVHVDLGTDATPVQVLVAQRQRRAPAAGPLTYERAATVAPK